MTCLRRKDLLLPAELCENAPVDGLARAAQSRASPGDLSDPEELHAPRVPRMPARD